MERGVTNAEKIRRIPWIFAGDALNSVFVQLTVFGSVFMLFLKEMGLPKGRIGLLVSLIPFCSVLAIFVAPATERWGLKRSFLFFHGLRKLFVAGLLLLPWVQTSWGSVGAFWYVAGIVLAFAMSRSVAETAFWPWSRTMVPDAMRGKFVAINSNIALVAHSLAMGVAAWVLSSGEGMGRFLALFGIGVCAGLVGVVCYSFFPGGGPVERDANVGRFIRDAFSTLKDRNFLVFSVAVTVVVFAQAPLVFTPLYLKEEIGFSDGTVVILPFAYMAGAFASSYLWGWSSDRYGAKPVMLFGLTAMLAPPVCWYLLPRESLWSLPPALLGYLLQGVGMTAWAIAANRCLLVNIIPPARKVPYFSLYYAWMGVAGGLGPLVSGWVIGACKNVRGSWMVFHVDQYTVAFAASLAVGVASIALMARLPVSEGVTARRFAGMFLRGRPFLALHSIIRHAIAGEERKRVEATQSLGDAHSPLSVEELVDALQDPSFNVRYEAVVSIARTRPDPKLVSALTEILAGDEPDLSIAAAWALGRMGSRDAILPLRETFLSGYPLLRARSARALAALGDTAIAPKLLEFFREETDDGLRMAYASAMGGLRAPEWIGDGLRFLLSLDTESSRTEMAFALARTIGREQLFVRLWRRTRSEPGTAISQEVERLRRGMKRLRPPASAERLAALGACSRAFGLEDLADGVQRLTGATPEEWMRDTHPTARILAECVARLREFEDRRREYLLLALHAMGVKLDGLTRDARPA